ncbi:MAG: hypothetical protein J6X44_09410, partial [Thermoguttaceae bacterium]|nr:hypothetical protein [Thermoguttaceae bacterium]
MAFRQLVGGEFFGEFAGIDLGDRFRDFRKIPQEDGAARPFLLDAFPTFQEQPELASDRLKSKSKFLLNLRIRGERFFR